LRGQREGAKQTARFQKKMGEERERIGDRHRVGQSRLVNPREGPRRKGKKVARRTKKKKGVDNRKPGCAYKKDASAKGDEGEESEKKKKRGRKGCQKAIEKKRKRLRKGRRDKKRTGAS